jgi:capsule polysaccharide export protein KpsE/RkpR
MQTRLDVSYDEYTTLLSLSVHWPSAARAKEIADGYLEIGDRLLREAAITEGERRVEELRREMNQTTVSDVGVFLAEEMTQAISSLTSIRARARYGFRVIDPPAAPDLRSWPPRTLFMILAGLITGLVELGALAGLFLRGVVAPDDA